MKRGGSEPAHREHTPTRAKQLAYKYDFDGEHSEYEVPNDDHEAVSTDSPSQTFSRKLEDTTNWDVSADPVVPPCSVSGNNDEELRQKFLQAARERAQAHHREEDTDVPKAEDHDYVYDWGEQQEPTNRSSIDLFSDRMHAQRDGYTIRGLLPRALKPWPYDVSSRTIDASVCYKEPPKYLETTSKLGKTDLGINDKTWNSSIDFVPISSALRTSYLSIRRCQTIMDVWLHCIRNDSTQLMLELLETLNENQVVELLNRMCIEEDSQNSLIFAAYVGATNCCGVLLEMGMDSGDTDIFGRSALHVAALNGHVDCCAILVDSAYAIIDIPDYNGNTALHLSASNGHYNCVSLLLEGAALLSVTNAEGQTPLHLAKGDACIECLIQRGASLISRDDFGRTPLYVAVMQERLDDVHCFCNFDEMGESLHIQDRQGNTPAHVCCHLDHSKSFSILLKANTSVSIENNAGDSARMIATKKNSECLKALKSFEADSGNKFNWRKYLDELSGNFYFYNVKTQQSLWEENISEYIRQCFSNEKSNSLADESTTNAEIDTKLRKPKFHAVLPVVTESEVETVRTIRTSRDERQKSTFLSSLRIDTCVGLTASSDRNKLSPLLQKAAHGLPAADHEMSSKVVVQELSPSVGQQEAAGEKPYRKDYVQLAKAYMKERPYREASDGSKEVTCLICDNNKAEEVFIPCEHACLCKRCIADHNVMSVPIAMKTMKAEPNQTRKPWTACPLCMQRIEAIVRIGKAESVVRHYGGSIELPEEFISTFAHAAEQLRRRLTG